MPMETDMLARIHPDAPQGLARGAQNTIGAMLHLKATVAEVNNDKKHSAVGRATVLKEYAKKQAVPELLKMKRQHVYAKALVDGQRTQLHKKASGEPLVTDEEFRRMLREMPAGERAAFILTHPEARGPALRQPMLAGISPDIVEHVMARELAEHHASDLASLNLAERTLEIHTVAVAELEKAVVSLPINISESSGEVYAYTRPAFDKWVDAELPGASAKEISAIERAQIAA